ncbi:ABC transporter permease [Paenibacillus pasadenensis]|uniref:Putative ABC transporter, permease protein (Putative) n=1 Tax=Paenibacillus pasadenensis TaxID=217090 RepID=A0A2N5N0G1_9BACL|nr:ABC transporter permease [Paenibacillus pasadenensis]PLT43827.1 putative ABC transporter, permease protein (putative) [Paenibacillus pasadenensis]
MKQFGLVFQYSFRERLRSKAFTLTIYIAAVLLAALIFLPKLLQSDSESVDGTIAVVNKTDLAVTSESLQQGVSPSYAWKLIEPSGEAEALAQLAKDDDSLLGLAAIEEKNGKPVLSLTVNKLDDAPYAEALGTYLQGAYTASELAKLTLDPAQKERVTAALQLDVQELKAGSKSMFSMYMPIYLISFMLYLLLYMCGGSVATSVSVEKSSRVKEILITKVKPEQLLFGKVLGVGLAGLLQFVLILGIGYGMILASGSGSGLSLFGFTVDFSMLDAKTMVLLVMFFILGYFFYAALFAACGSLVSRSEEVNAVTLPVSLLMMGGFVVALLSLGSPEGSLAVVSSYIPFATPFAMFVRIGMSDPSWTEILVPTLILLASSVLACWISAKVYQVGVLLYGQKPTPKLIYKALRSTM